MTRTGSRSRRDERGATLILAIAFLVVIGGIGAAVVSSVTSSFADRNVLDQVRNRQYAADAGIELAIAEVRAKPVPGPGIADCGPAAHPTYYRTVDYYTALNGVDIRVDCKNNFGQTTTGYLQRNVVFTACVDGSGPCTDPIVRAQVNFEAGDVDGVGQLHVTRTWVQSWSVNG